MLFDQATSNKQLAMNQFMGVYQRVKTGKEVDVKKEVQKEGEEVGQKFAQK